MSIVSLFSEGHPWVCPYLCVSPPAPSSPALCPALPSHQLPSQECVILFHGLRLLPWFTSPHPQRPALRSPVPTSRHCVPRGDSRSSLWPPCCPTSVTATLPKEQPTLQPWAGCSRRATPSRADKGTSRGPPCHPPARLQRVPVGKLLGSQRTSAWWSNLWP